MPPRPNHRPHLVPLLLTLTLLGCKSARVRNAELISKRTGQLASLSKWSPTWCRVDAHLTAPALSRYRQIFPQDVDRVADKGLPFTWKATESSCEVTALDRAPLSINFQSVLDTALCLLVQTHFVNSPFDELKPVAVESRDKMTFLRTGDEKDLGVWLDREKVVIETRTKSRGTLTARYEETRGVFLPERLTQRVGKTIIDVDQIEYASEHGPAVHRQLRSFEIDVGEEKARPFANVEFSECRPY